MVVLRKNGRIEFYLNFMLIDDFYDEDKIAVDIETGLRSFFFQFRTPSGDDIYMKCNTAKFGMNYTTKIPKPKKGFVRRKHSGRKE